LINIDLLKLKFGHIVSETMLIPLSSKIYPIRVFLRISGRGQQRTTTRKNPGEQKNEKDQYLDQY